MQKWISGARLSAAKASEKPTFTGVPSGRLPSRSKCMTSDAAMPAARNAASSSCALCDSRMSKDRPSPRAGGEGGGGIGFGRRVEIAHGMDDVIETAGHDDPAFVIIRDPPALAI